MNNESQDRQVEQPSTQESKRKRNPKIEEYGKTFDLVLNAELDEIRRRREDIAKKQSNHNPTAQGTDSLSYKASSTCPATQHSDSTPGKKPTDLEIARRKALQENLTGLAFSGGGIRSGTLAIGFLQGLARLKLLTQFDYLSTVSGGGYAGSWLAAWIKRDGDVQNVQQLLDPSRKVQAHADRGPEVLSDRVIDEEPEPLYHLRAYSNYLTPRPGTFTTDTWTVFSIYLRNLLINLAILVPAAMLVVLVARLVVWFFSWSGAGGWFATVCFLALLVAALGFLIYEQGKLKIFPNAQKCPKEEWPPRKMLVRIVWPLVAVAITSVWLLSIAHNCDKAYRLPGELTSNGGNSEIAVIGPVVNAFYKLPPLTQLPVLFAVLLLVIYAASLGYRALFGKLTSVRDAARLTLSFVVMGAVGGLLFQAILEAFVWRRFYATPPVDRLATYPVEPYALATFGPPLVLLALVFAGFAQIAVGGRAISEHEREWRSRLGALLLLHALSWLALFGIILYLPWAIEQSRELWEKLPASLTVGGILAWLGTTITGVLFSKAPESGGGEAGGSVGGGGSKGLRLVAALAPAVFLIGLLVLTSWIVSLLPGIDGPGSDFLSRMASGSASEIGKWMGILAVATILMLGLVNVNLFSLHSMYANRLARCYLGASQTKRTWARRWRSGGTWGPGVGGSPIKGQKECRRENRFTGFDPNDDFPLYELQTSSTSSSRCDGYTGPFPLINTALNLIAGDELAYQDRKAESFVLTPLYYGSEGTGYAKLPNDDPDAELTLGRAMAISGAAADPNMGYNQSAAQTALMTVFNARLGWWIQNPNLHEGWAARSPNYGGLLFDELFGKTTRQGKHVHLSDGGHFENLGIYELVRRRCRYIVACDLAEDRSDASENLANAIRLCRRDFGVGIEIDTASLRQGTDKLSAVFFWM